MSARPPHPLRLTVSGVSSTNERETGRDTLAEVSTAWTVMVLRPTARFGTVANQLVVPVAVCHAVTPAVLVNCHCTWATATLSLAPPPIWTVELVKSAPAAGPLVMDAVGGVVSTIWVRASGNRLGGFLVADVVHGDAVETIALAILPCKDRAGVRGV